MIDKLSTVYATAGPAHAGALVSSAAVSRALGLASDLAFKQVNRRLFPWAQLAR